ncbi:MAG: hypothetical protein NTX05_01000 [Fusobacteria bacterium]|nr:hypothetical protein [Fusobacteriota bacterium]
MNNFMLELEIKASDINQVKTLLNIENEAIPSVITAFFVQGMVSSAIGKLLGDGAIYREQETEYFSQVHVNDVLTLRVEIAEIQEKRVFKLAKIKIECKNQNNAVLARGLATGIPPKSENQEIL